MNKELSATLLVVKQLLLAFRDHAKTREQKQAIELGIALMEKHQSWPSYNWRRKR